jgi:hypothetical protein
MEKKNWPLIIQNSPIMRLLARGDLDLKVRKYNTICIRPPISVLNYEFFPSDALSHEIIKLPNGGFKELSKNMSVP